VTCSSDATADPIAFLRPGRRARAAWPAAAGERPAAERPEVERPAVERPAVERGGARRIGDRWRTDGDGQPDVVGVDGEQSQLTITYHHRP
jgi:hypothetical protein